MSSGALMPAAESKVLRKRMSSSSVKRSIGSLVAPNGASSRLLFGR